MFKEIIKEARENLAWGDGDKRDTPHTRPGGPSCAQCGSRMRKVSRGGSRFWSCPHHGHLRKINS